MVLFSVDTLAERASQYDWFLRRVNGVLVPTSISITVVVQAQAPSPGREPSGHTLSSGYVHCGQPLTRWIDALYRAAKDLWPSQAKDPIGQVMKFVHRDRSCASFSVRDEKGVINDSSAMQSLADELQGKEEQLEM